MCIYSSRQSRQIKSDFYHTTPLAGFADWYFNIFPNGDNVANNAERKKHYFDAHQI